MLKRVFLLTGLAVLAVVCNHTSFWGEVAMFWWADRYRPVSIPNFDLDATLPYYFLLAERKLALFGVPAFLFFSGFFVSYAARGSASGLSWKTVRTRVQALLIPYVLWSVLWLSKEFLEGTKYTLGGYATRLLLGWPMWAYWYIPLICFYYLLSPFLARLAQTRGHLLLFIAGLLQLFGVGLVYVRLGQDLLGIHAPWLDGILTFYTYLALYIILAFFFVLGLVVGVHRQEFESRLAGHEWHLLFAALVLGALAVFEAELVYRSTSLDWRSSIGTIPSVLYALTIILFFLAIRDIPKAISSICHRLASKMYGMYLLHFMILEFTARATQKFIPWLLACPVLLQFVLVFVSVAGSMLIMEAVSRSPLRRYYKYLFG